MRFRFFTVPVFDPRLAEAELNRFLAEHRVLSVERQVVSLGSTPVWSICVSYVDPAQVKSEAGASKPTKVDYRKVLSPEDFAAFARLRDLRKRLAEEAGVPAYALFSNEQLAALVRRRVTTRAAMAEIDGVGEARMEKYGAPFLEVLRRLFDPSANGVGHAST